MPKNDTTTKFKADISQLKNAMQDAARQVRLSFLVFISNKELFGLSGKKIIIFF